LSSSAASTRTFSSACSSAPLAKESCTGPRPTSWLSRDQSRGVVNR
jgi:hypothetical protein